MAHVLVTLTALLGVAAPAVSASAASPAQQPLRHLVYATRYSMASTRTQRTSGLTGSVTAVGSVSASNSSSATVANAGTLTIDVVAFDKAGALVVDTSLAGDHRSQTPVRVAIFADGRLGVDPAFDLSDEARRLLPLLAGSFVGGRDVIPNASWSVPLGTPPAGAMTVHVGEVTEDRAQLQIDASLRAGGIANFEETSHADAVYAVKVLVPVSYDVTAHIRRTPAVGVDESAEMRLSASLVSDSFAPRR